MLVGSRRWACDEFVGGDQKSCDSLFGFRRSAVVLRKPLWVAFLCIRAIALWILLLSVRHLIRVEPKVRTFDLFRSAEKAGGVTTLTVVSLFK
jgi:hypothetical protein